MKALLKKRNILLAGIGVFLCIAILSTSLLLRNTGNTFYSEIQPADLSEDSVAAFRDDVKIALPNEQIRKGIKEVAQYQNGSYMLRYKSALPSFFESVQVGDVFCVYPDKNAQETYFQLGFCGKLLEKSTDENSVRFEIPMISEAFRTLKINMEEAVPTQTTFYPSDNVRDFSVALERAHALSAEGDASFSIGDTDIDFSYRKNDREAIQPGYHVLCRQLKIDLKQNIDDEFEIDGSLTLDYPAVKFFLDYETNEATDEVVVNDYAFDFVTKEKINLSFTGKRDIEPLEHREDLLDKITPVNIVDVTESEPGKYVLGTYVVGYNVKLPEIFPVSLNNTENDVGYLSLGIAFQLALTAKGEIEISCNYTQSGLLGVSAAAGENARYLLKGYDYPHPIVDDAEPDGSQAQESPTVNSSYQGELSFSAGVSVDVGICILGMLPVKLANGIEADMQTEFLPSRADEEITVVENTYVENQDGLTFSVDVYSDLKAHIGAEPKIGGTGTAVSVDAVIQIFRENLIRIPKAADFTLKECRVGGVQLGSKYSDEQLAAAVADYAVSCKDYSILSYTKDAAINTALNEILSAFDIQAQELLGDWQAEYPDGKFDCYASGAIYVRNAEDVVVSILLFGEQFRNEAGLHTGLSSENIERLYSTPSESYSVELEVGFLVELFAGLNINDIHAQALAYQGKDGACRMEILAADNTSKIILLTTV